MAAPNQSENDKPSLDQTKPGKNLLETSSSPSVDANADTVAQQRTELTAEEQMALYEKALKEDDWGHQPC